MSLRLPCWLMRTAIVLAVLVVLLAATSWAVLSQPQFDAVVELVGRRAAAPLFLQR